MGCLLVQLYQGARTGTYHHWASALGRTLQNEALDVAAERGDVAEAEAETGFGVWGLAATTRSWL